MIDTEVSFTSLCYIFEDYDGSIWLNRLADIENGKLHPPFKSGRMDNYFENRDRLYRNDGPSAIGTVGVWDWTAIPNRNNPDIDYVQSYYVQEELFIQILETIIQNLVRAGFKMIIAHGHGPSTHLFEEKKEYFEKKYNIETSTLWNLGIPGDDGIQTDHAATNETILTMALHPDLVDLDKLPKDDVPVSVWGPDPRKFASVEYGEKVIYDNVDIICQRLIPIIEKLTKPVINLNYHHVKNMLRDKNEN
jgi:hypothetical protein